MARPFSKINRAKTAEKLFTRQLKTASNARQVATAGQAGRNITPQLVNQFKRMHVSEQLSSTLLDDVPLMSRQARMGDAGVKRRREEVELLTATLGFMEDNDHRLTGVCLQNEKLDDEWACVIASCLENNTVTRSVNLNDNFITDSGAAALASMLRWNRAITSLSLGGNEIGDRGAQSLANVISRQRCSLARLNLAARNPSSRMSGCSRKSPQITLEGATALSLCLTHNMGCRLSFLELRGQLLGDAGAASLGQALQNQRCSLVELGLARNKIGDAGAKGLAEGLSCNGVMRRLDLASNRVGCQGCVAIAAAMLQHGSMELLDLSCNQVGDVGLRAIYQCMDASPLVLQCLLQGNPAEDKQLLSAVEFLCEARKPPSARNPFLPIRGYYTNKQSDSKVNVLTLRQDSASLPLHDENGKMNFYGRALTLSRGQAAREMREEMTASASTPIVSTIKLHHKKAGIVSARRQVMATNESYRLDKLSKTACGRGVKPRRVPVKSKVLTNHVKNHHFSSHLLVGHDRSGEIKLRVPKDLKRHYFALQHRNKARWC
ncbi:unnamed protein product [Chrysoparadoxa australica]